MSEPRQLPLALDQRPALGREALAVGACNAEAVAWIDAWPAWPAPAVVVHGPAGGGKTHLVHAFAEKSGAAVMTGARLAEADAPALAAAGAVAVDDADGVAGTAGEQPLLHLYNLMNEQGGALFLTARTPVRDWPLRLPDLASRLRAAPTAAITLPDDALFAAVLQKLFADRQLDPGEAVINYLLTHMERSFAAARNLVAAADRRALAERKGITVPLVRGVLEAGPPATDPSAG